MVMFITAEHQWRGRWDIHNAYSENWAMKGETERQREREREIERERER